MEKRGCKIWMAIGMVCLFLLGLYVTDILWTDILCSDKTVSDEAIEHVFYVTYILLTVATVVYFIHEIVGYETEDAIKSESDEDYIATLEASNETYKQSIDELMDEIRSLRTQIKDSSKKNEKQYQDMENMDRLIRSPLLSTKETLDEHVKHTNKSV